MEYFWLDENANKSWPFLRHTLKLASTKDHGAGYNLASIISPKGLSCLHILCSFVKKDSYGWFCFPLDFRVSFWFWNRIWSSPSWSEPFNQGPNRVRGRKACAVLIFVEELNERGMHIKFKDYTKPEEDLASWK